MFDAAQLATALAVIGLAETASWRAPRGPEGVTPPAPRGWFVAALLVTVLAMAVRAWTAEHVVGLGNEYVAVARACRPHRAEALGDLAAILHAPLHEHLLRAWIAVLDHAGAPPTATWMRLLNIPLTGLLVVALARLGLALRAPWAGVASGALYAASPFLLQLHANQENYLIEGLAGMCFAERLAVCLVVGRPSFRTLAASAAFALAAGYMNAPLLGAGAVAASVTLARRGELRGVVRALGWTLALAGPLVGRILHAATALRTISRDAGAQAALMHQSMPMHSAFGGGDPRRLIDQLLAAVGGPLGRVALAAACGALLLRPRHASVGAAALVATWAAGLRLPFNIQNYAPAALVFLFLSCWGVEELAGRAAALACRRRPHAAWRLAAVGAVCAFAGALGVTTLRRWPLRREHNYFVPYRDVAPLRAALAGAPGVPLMILGQRIPDHEFIQVCRGAATVRALVACVEGARNPAYDRAWTVRETAGLRVASPTENLTSPSVPRALGGEALAFLSAAPWSAGFFVWVGTDLARSSQHVGDLARRVESRCPQLRSTGKNTLRRCPPAALP